jgi:protocatechuate 3,4-dioxygenase beta subunit
LTNETELLTPSPETVVPEEENLTTPVSEENVTTVEPANETEAAKTEPVAVNQTPVLNSLTADLSSPQVPGSSITWTADASDAENDSLSYRFYLSGPGTAGEWQMASDWSASNSWIQKTTSTDVGENQVKVQIRDGKHASGDGYDGEATALFTISELLLNISGMAYQDKNGNNVLDEGEGLAGWTIKLTRPDGSELSALTGSDGAYRFEQLKAGSYKVAQDTPSGWSVEPASGYDVDLQGADATDRNFVNKLSAFSISGMKFNDLDGNGINDGEPGMEGWTIKLTGNGLDNQAVQKEMATGADGSYKFEGLSPGTYTVSEVEQSGWKRTAPAEGSHTVSLSDADVTGKDFGNHGSWSISGSVFLDANGNGARDAEEAGRAGWSVQLSRDGAVINASTTAEDGSYAFKNLAPGKYTLSQAAQEGWKVSMPAEGSYSVDLSDADVSGKDFGITGDLSISGQKYYDINGNGVQDADEPGIPGGDVSLVLEGKVIANTTTDDNGVYTFDNILPGTYTINDPVPSGLVLTTPSTVTVIVTGSTVVKANFGLVGMNAISGMKFNDKNGNGAKDAGEGEGGWDIVLTGNAWFGKPLQPRTTTTAPDGSYKFDKLIPGSYKVSETSRTGWTQIYPAGGSHTVSFGFQSPPSESNDFGNKVVAQSISGIKYNDLNGNGNRDPGESGLKDWTINLEQPAGTVIKTTVTAADGSYSFSDLSAGTYVVSEVLQTGWTQKAPPGGKHTVTLTASTSSASGKDFGNSINNLPPKNPTLVSNKPSPQMAGTQVRWTAGANDPEGDNLFYRFYVSGPTTGGVMQPQTEWRDGIGANVWTWSTGAFASGNYQIEAWIRDGKHAGQDGFDVKKTVSFALGSANRPPRVDVLFSDRPAPQFVGSWVRWTAVARDPEGDPLQFKFYLRGPATRGFWMDQTGWRNSNHWTWRTDPWDVGISEVLVAVRDGKHAGPGGSDDYATAAYSIIILNRPPAITGLASNVMGPQPIGAAIRWQASAIDPEGNPVYFRYWLNGPATRGVWRMVRDWSTDPNWIWFTSPADAGVSHIQVQVMDGLHTSPMGWDDDAGALFTVLRPNQPPALLSLKPDKPSPLSAGTPVRWTATASDPDREPIYFKFWLKGPSTGNAWKVVQDWSVKNQWIWASTGYDGGAYSVYVYARDGKHNPDKSYDSALGATFTLSPNQPPKVTALTPDKKIPQSAGTVIRWTASAIDADKDPILFQFWLKGPATAGAWRVAQDWSARSQWIWTSAPIDGGMYRVYVFASDGRHKPPNSYDSAMGLDYQLINPLPSSRVVVVGRR